MLGIVPSLSKKYPVRMPVDWGMLIIMRDDTVRWQEFVAVPHKAQTSMCHRIFQVVCGCGPRSIQLYEDAWGVEVPLTRFCAN